MIVIKTTAILFLQLILFLLFGCSASEQVPEPGKQESFILEKEVIQTYRLNFLLYLPEDYNTQPRKWPLVLFLHGVGERGTDINLVKKHGPPKLVEEGKQFSFILVSPQCPDKTSWDTKMLVSLLDEIESKYNVDKNRIYLTGLSMGGHATWSLAIENPERFAAIAPVSARGYAQDVCVLKNVPVWVFHGAKDDIVQMKDDQKMVDELKECGGNVNFTIYPEAGHDAWTETYNNQELYDWLLSCSRNNEN